MLVRVHYVSLRRNTQWGNGHLHPAVRQPMVAPVAHCATAAGPTPSRRRPGQCTRTRALRNCCTRRGLPAEFGSPHRAPTTKKESAAGTNTVTRRCARNTAVCTHVGNEVLQPDAAVAAGRLLHKRIWTAKHRRVECHAFDGVPLAKPRRVLAIVCDVHPAPNTDTQILATKAAVVTPAEQADCLLQP